MPRKPNSSLPSKAGKNSNYEADPKPDDGIMFTDGADHPSLPDPQPEGGRGEKWPFPPTSKRCTAHSRQRTKAAIAANLIPKGDKRRCRRPVTAGQTKCRWHGGATREGWHGGNAFVDGRYSASAGRLREAYESSLADGTLFELREGVALLDAVVQRALERVNDLDTPFFRHEALRHYRAARDASANNKPDDARRELDALGHLLERGCEEDASLKFLTEAVELFQKRVEEAWKIKLTRDETMNIRDLVAVLGRLANIIYEKAANIETPDGEPVADVIMLEIDTFVRGLGTEGAAGREARKRAAQRQLREG